MVMLVVDNDDSFCRNLIISLESMDNKVLVANDQVNAFNLISKFSPDKIVVEQHLGFACGLDLIKPILQINESAKIIILSRYGCIADAVKAVKLGAYNYLPKPVTAQMLVQAFELHTKFLDAKIPSKKKPMSFKRFEWEFINTVLANKKGNISATARELGLDRRTLQRKLKKYPSIS